MRSRITSTFAALALAATAAFFAPTSQAAFINGNMSFNGGGVSPLASNGTAITIPSATPIAGLDFLGTATVSPFGTDGDYSSAIGGNVTFVMDPYYFSNAGLLWSAGMFDFYVSSAFGVERSNTLDVFGTGVVKAPGFDDTPGTWVLTTQGTTKVMTWSSAIATSVPDGGTTAALLGVALLGLHGIRRKLVKG